MVFLEEEENLSWFTHQKQRNLRGNGMSCCATSLDRQCLQLGVLEIQGMGIMGFRVWGIRGLGFRGVGVWGVWIWVWGSIRAQGLGFKVMGMMTMRP